MVGLKFNNAVRSVDLAYLKNSAGAAVQVQDDSGFTIQNAATTNSVNITASSTTELTIDGILKFASGRNLNLNENQALGFRVENFTGSDPSPGNAGRLIFRTDTTAFKVDDGTAFQTLATSSFSGDVSTTSQGYLSSDGGGNALKLHDPDGVQIGDALSSTPTNTVVLQATGAPELTVLGTMIVKRDGGLTIKNTAASLSTTLTAVTGNRLHVSGDLEVGTGLIKMFGAGDIENTSGDIVVAPAANLYLSTGSFDLGNGALITHSGTNQNLTLTPDGTGIISLAKDTTVTTGHTLSTNTLQATTTNGNLTIQPNGTGSFVIIPTGKTLKVDSVQANGATDLSLIAGTTNNNVNINPSGTGKVVVNPGSTMLVDTISVSTSTSTNLTLGGGTGSGSVLLNPGTTGKVTVLAGKNLQADTVEASTTNGDLTVQPNGTGSNVTVPSGKFLKLTGATSGAVPFFNASAQIVNNNANLAFNSGTNTLTSGTFRSGTFTSTQVLFWNASGDIVGTNDLVFNTAASKTTATKFSTSEITYFDSINGLTDQTFTPVSTTTTDATVTQIGPNFTVNGSETASFSVVVTGKCTGGAGGNTGKSVMIRMDVAFHATGTAVSVIGADLKTTIANERDGTWDISYDIATNNVVKITVAGGTTDNISWRGWIENTTI